MLTFLAMNDIQEQFKKQFPAVRFDEPLSKHGTFMIGGPADYFYTATSTDEIAPLLKFANQHQLPVHIAGKGSNTLYHDNGFRGLILQIATTTITFDPPSATVTADAGVIVAKLIMESLQGGFSGLEKWVGLPGTVGGAVRGNAGCNGLETKDILLQATLLDPKTTETRTLNNHDLQYHYRHSILKDQPALVLSATFQLQKEGLTPAEQKQIMAEIRQFRLSKQPSGSSTGSFFKNPSPDQPAGKLIDQAGLKGTKIGQAQISELHGNFFLNLGGATAADILSLCQLAQKEVKFRFNITLEPEVHILPERPSEPLHHL